MTRCADARAVPHASLLRQQHIDTRAATAQVVTPNGIADWETDFTVLNACAITNENWEKHGLNSEVFVALSVEKKLQVSHRTPCALANTHEESTWRIRSIQHTQNAEHAAHKEHIYGRESACTQTVRT